MWAQSERACAGRRAGRSGSARGARATTRSAADDRAVSRARSRCAAGTLSVQPIALGGDVVAGQLDVVNVPYVLETLTAATDGCLEGRFAGLVTGPVQKSIINDAGVAFSGHTEFLAERCGCATVVMLLVADDLRVALATTHVPLSAVPALITRARLTQVLDVLLGGSDAALRHRATARAGCRPESARRRGRSPRTRRDRRHRAGVPGVCAPWCRRAAAGRHAVHPTACSQGRTRCSRCTTIRDCRC